MREDLKKTIAERKRLLVPRYLRIVVGHLLLILATPFRRWRIKRFVSERRKVRGSGPRVSLSDSRDSTERPEPLHPEEFRQINENGFGDRQNSIAWSMAWWKGRLYVGTMRAFRCVENYLVSQIVPVVKYPPRSPAFECTPNPLDLPLQAEIWCYTPEIDRWERVYRSPRDVAIPGSAGNHTAREIGYRYMALFEERDGTEALYVSGVSSRPINHGAPPPRLLRSEDGVTFTPVPQDPDTVLGELEAAGFRTIVVHEGRFFITAGRFFGSGALFESTDPKEGNDHFTRITPEGMEVFSMALYNGALYLGLNDFKRGYSVVKMDIDRKRPCPIRTVVPSGAYRRLWGSNCVTCMKVFRDRLYVGCDSPPELIRINPDDSWDLIVGMPRRTPQGRKYPLSGMEDGFDNWLNIHIYSMEVHDGDLYAGTGNPGQYWLPFPVIGKALKPYMGFTLCSTSDGEEFRFISRNGFDNIRSHGIRTFQSTPHGLFMGTLNFFHGAEIFLGRRAW